MMKMACSILSQANGNGLKKRKKGIWCRHYHLFSRYDVFRVNYFLSFPYDVFVGAGFFVFFFLFLLCNLWLSDGIYDDVSHAPEKTVKRFVSKIFLTLSMYGRTIHQSIEWENKKRVCDEPISKCVSVVTVAVIYQIKRRTFH